MASVSTDKKTGRRRVLFFDANNERRTLSLADTPKREADQIAGHVEHIVSSQIHGQAVPAETARWIAELNGKLRRKLVAVGLLEQPKAELDAEKAAVANTLDVFVTAYIDDRAGVEPGTKEIWHRARKNLVAFFGSDKPLNEITTGDAVDFWNFLIRPANAKSPGAGLKESTARKRYTHACMFFLHAKRKKLVTENPFADNGVSKSNVAAEEYVFLSTDDAGRVLEQLPATQWKLLFALSRWGGLRIGSEARRLTWDDIDFENQRFTVHAKKTKRYRGHESRVVPMFPELASLFETRWHELEDGTPGDAPVLPLLQGRTDASLIKPIRAAAKRAGVEAWPRLWQNLRATR